MIYYEPSQEEVIKNLQSPLQTLIETINTFICLEPDIVRMLNLERKASFAVSEELPLFRDALKYIEELTNKGFEEPNEVLEKFKEYEFLLHKSKDEIAKSFMDKDKNQEKKSVTDLDEYISKITDSIVKLQGLCINQKNSTFFQIRTAEIKETLIKKAKDILEAVLSRVSNDCMTNVKNINENYNTLKDTLMKEPESEEE